MSDIDLSRYRPHVEHLDMPDADKDELLIALWRIMENFVDRAFGEDPVQQRGAIAIGSGDNDVIDAARYPLVIGSSAENDEADSPAVVHSSQPSETENNQQSLAGSFRATSGGACGRKQDS